MLAAALALVANALAVIVVARFLPNQVTFYSWTVGNLTVDTWTSVGIFAVVVGVLNAVLRPVVNILTFPIGCLTLGLFSIVINGLIFWLAARANVGVNATFVGATITALAAGLLNSIFGALTTEREDRRW